MSGIKALWIKIKSVTRKVLAYFLPLSIGTFPLYSYLLRNDIKLVILYSQILLLLYVLVDFIIEIHDSTIIGEKKLYKNFTESDPKIKKILAQSFRRNNTTEVIVIGVAMKFSWPFLKNIIEQQIDSPDFKNSLHLNFAFIDHNWSEFQNAPVWQRESKIVNEQIEELKKRPEFQKLNKDGRLKIQVNLYSHMPDRHGILIDNEFLFLSHCTWKFSDENKIEQLKVGQNPYELFDKSSEEGRIRIMEFQSLYKFCCTYRINKKMLPNLFNSNYQQDDSLTSKFIFENDQFTIDILAVNLNEIWPQITKELSQLLPQCVEREKININIHLLSRDKHSAYGIRQNQGDYKKTEDNLKYAHLLASRNPFVQINVIYFHHFPNQFGIMINSRHIFLQEKSWKHGSFGRKPELRFTKNLIYVHEGRDSSSYFLTNFNEDLKDSQIRSPGIQKQYFL